MSLPLLSVLFLFLGPSLFPAGSPTGKIKDFNHALYIRLSAEFNQFLMALTRCGTAWGHQAQSLVLRLKTLAYLFLLGLPTMTDLVPTNDLYFVEPARTSSLK